MSLLVFAVVESVVVAVGGAVVTVSAVVAQRSVVVVSVLAFAVLVALKIVQVSCHPLVLHNHYLV